MTPDPFSDVLSLTNAEAVVTGGFTVVPERYQELQQEQEATR